MTGPKELAYDSEVAPLMSDLIAVCKRHGISIVAQFELDTAPDGAPLLCTTAIVPSSANPRTHALASFARHGFVAMAVRGPASTPPPPPTELPS